MVKMMSPPGIYRFVVEQEVDLGRPDARRSQPAVSINDALCFVSSYQSQTITKTAVLEVMRHGVFCAFQARFDRKVIRSDCEFKSLYASPWVDGRRVKGKAAHKLVISSPISTRIGPIRTSQPD